MKPELIVDSGLFQSLPDAGVILDASLQICHVNSKAESMFEFSEKELHEENFRILLDSPLDFPQESLIKSLPQETTSWQETTRLRYYGQSKTGRRFFVNFSSAIFLEGNRIMVLIRDISEFIHNSIHLESAKKRLDEAFVINRIGTWE